MSFRCLTRLIALGLLAVVSTNAMAQSASDLLDRGSNPGATRGPMLMTNTLFNGLGTPGVTIGAIMTAAPPASAGSFHGYFFAPPTDIPTSYYPFFVTGAYVWAAPPIFASPIVGAGAVAGPFTVSAGTWAAFIAAPVPAGVFSPGMIFGGKGLFGSGSMGMPVASGLGVACGFDPAVAGPVLGGLTPGTGGGKPVVSFVPPGTMSGLGPIAAPPATYIAGCFVTGATVPVELQSFSVN